jgi:hypothetical protein
MSDKYQILGVPKLKAKLKKDLRDLLDYDAQLSTNHAFMYIMKSGEVILLPNNFGDEKKGIIFKDKQVFDSHVAADNFPIENYERVIEELFQSEITDIVEQLPRVAQYLSDLYGLRRESLTIQQILEAAQMRSRKKISHKEIMYRELLLGEFIRQSVKGRWILLKRYGTYNPYYVPGVINESQSIIVLSAFVNFYFTDVPISLEFFLRDSRVQQPLLKFRSSRFSSSYHGYKMIDSV